MSNPFQSIPDAKKPKAAVTDYHTRLDDNIIEFSTIQKVKKTGDKDTDFVLIDEVIETNCINRQKYIDSFSNEVGILNIIEKVRLSGDVSLLNQTHRVSMVATEKDVFGHDIEPVVDVSQYQVDRISGLESFKDGVAAYETLDPELKKKLSLEGVAKLTDSEIDQYLAAKKAEIIAARNAEKEGSE